MSERRFPSTTSTRPCAGVPGSYWARVLSLSMDLTAFVDGLVHEPTQTEGRGLGLTVNAVQAVNEPGSIDFGGGELEPAGTEPIRPERRDPDDDYGWWDLEGGTYLIELNESLSAPVDVDLVLQPRDEVRARGASHPTLHLGGDEPLDAVPLAVPDGGIRIKENARVSTLLAR